MTPLHYNDVITSEMASQITSVSIVCSSIYSGADQRKHQSSASLALVQGIHRWPVTGEFPAQKTSKVENASIWWRHHISVWVSPVLIKSPSFKHDFVLLLEEKNGTQYRSMIDFYNYVLAYRHHVIQKHAWKIEMTIEDYTRIKISFELQNSHLCVLGSPFFNISMN